MMNVYNSLTRRFEELKPLEGNEIRLYTCGPTVYNFAHIGNFRAYAFEDILRRVVQFNGMKIRQVMNLTDVDDKTIRGANAAGVALTDYTKTYKDAFFADLKKLNIQPAEVYPAATDHIPEMIALVQKLMDKGVAYQSEDGSVYFKVREFPGYGKLAHIDFDNQRTGLRCAADEYDKENVGDFALWKAWEESDGPVGWDSPWGRGRPGWHIECSAMSIKYLGETFDLHTGGIDNLFPHHENEIAQAAAATGKEVVRTWMHCAHLRVNGEKMSKSRGNVVDPNDVIDEFGADVLRLYVLFMGDYEKAAPWSESSVKGCKRFVDRVWALQDRITDSDDYSDALRSAMHKTIKKVTEDIEAMKFNTAIAAMMSLLNEIYNVGSVTKKEFRDLLIILYPFAPHITEELYQLAGFEGILSHQEWVDFDEALCVDKTIEIVAQINGKIRAKLTIPADAAKEDVLAMAKADEAIIKAAEGKSIVKEIYVPGKLVNIVVK